MGRISRGCKVPGIVTFTETDLNIAVATMTFVGKYGLIKKPNATPASNNPACRYHLASFVIMPVNPADIPIITGKTILAYVSE